ncbi:hypothetical protein SLEP1_g9509 [Rubroshorea leprosula]|uniref:Integrase catalytic domain-containing protein n=1 Tax=Rubroshorea leprosula TaxID=152421 RepID=A0AAV5IEH3_9ROSI|nr:hypothetical protein SLEP1_g9509 [Rubroshorea leprosula]
MQQQFGVFQLVLAQLLARNSLDDLLINLLNPAHLAIPHQQHQPVNSPVQSVASLKNVSQLRSHIPPLPPNPPNPPQPMASNVSKRLDNLKRMMAKNRAATSGQTNPDDHLHAFCSVMQAQNASDVFMCKIFPSTLHDNARTWFNDAVLEIGSFDQAVGITAITQGLSQERFRDSLIKHPPASCEEVNKRSCNFITTEEYVLSQKPLAIKDNRNPTWKEEGPNKKKFKAIQNRGPFSTKVDKPSLGTLQATGRQPTWTAFTLPRLQILMQIKNKMDLKRPPPIRSLPTSKDHTKYCDYHQDHGHTTEACNMLKSELESLARKGMLNEFIPNKDHSRFVREQRLDSQPPKGLKLPVPVQLEALSTQQVKGVELPNNRPADEARVAPMEEIEEIQIDDNDPTKKTQIKTRLKPGEREELISFLKANKDVFTWTSADMLGVPTLVAMHKLSTNPLKKPVAFVRRVDYYEWVANLVMVKKSNGKWRMRIDYTNLNDACPKDCHPMPNIDKLVEAASGNEKLSLLDAYSGYHQVRIAPKDEVKTSFYAGDEIYCYVMIPFGLKNAGATYQKMVTIVFRAQIGRKLEVYVDDIVVKSCRAEDHLIDLVETFNNLRRYNMKLNPTKCTFDVESGNFLSFMVSKRGIEVNPKKIKAIEQMKPPRSTKDVHRLAGRVKAYLSSLPLLTKAKGGEIFYLYLRISNTIVSSILVREMGKQQQPVYLIDLAKTFNNLRRYSMKLDPTKCTLDVESGKFLSFMVSKRGLEVNPEKIKAIKEMKPPRSTKDVQRLARRVAALHRFISKSTNKCLPFFKVLRITAQKDETGKTQKKMRKQQQPVYYASKVLQGAEQRYSIAERAALAVVVTAKKLRSHFQSHPLIVMTNQPLRQILQKPKCSERLIKWAVELGEFQITFQQWLAIRAQALADFIVHEGVCGSHVGAQTLAHKVLQQGYYWPNMQEDAKRFVQKCQFFAHLTHQPVEELTNMVTPWPFAQWGIDLLSLFIKAVGGATHLVVSVDYFTKWVEAWPLSCLTSRRIKDFLFRSVICRYGIPNQAIANNGPQFNCNSFKDFCSNYGIKLVFTSVYHPEANGIAESANVAIL